MTTASPRNRTAYPGMPGMRPQIHTPLIATSATGSTVAIVWDPDRGIGGVYDFGAEAWTVTEAREGFGPREFLADVVAGGVTMPPRPQGAPYGYDEAWVRCIGNRNPTDDLEALEAEMRRRFRLLDPEIAAARIREFASEGQTEADIVRSTGWEINDVRRALEPRPQ